MPMDTDRCLTVAMPCYNERSTIDAIVAAVLESSLVGELIVVDDGSTDGTRDGLDALGDPRITAIFHDHNQGKGAALRTAFNATTCPFVIVQDTDLEYDPAEPEHSRRADD